MMAEMCITLKSDFSTENKTKSCSDFLFTFFLGKCDIVSGPPRAKNPVPPSVYLLFENFWGGLGFFGECRERIWRSATKVYFGQSRSSGLFHADLLSLSFSLSIRMGSIYNNKNSSSRKIDVYPEPELSLYALVIPTVGWTAQ